jgi:SAM-dependent methyltransferase
VDVSTTFSPAELEALRRSRRHPRRSQFDYLYLSRLARDLRAALAQVPEPVRDVLDIWCGSRPYDDLMPDGAHVVGIDVLGNPYGVADVVSDEFLPFDDASFDLVTCIEAFHYIEDPVHGLFEIRRVLRPGGTLVISVPFAFEYDRTILEHRYTGPELIALLGGWEGVKVIESGGRVIAWAILTAMLLERVRSRLPSPLRTPFALLIALLNGVAVVLDRFDARHSAGPMALPINLFVTARRPEAG